MSGSLVPDLGISPEVWLFLSLFSVVTLFFKFNRVWSVRNLDLLLLFSLAPGFLLLMTHSEETWIGFAWLLLGSLLLLGRCFADLGLARRPLLEPNLNSQGLSFLMAGMLGLLMVEAANLPMEQSAGRNPAEPSQRSDLIQSSPTVQEALVDPLWKGAPLPSAFKRTPAQEVLARVLVCLGHLLLVIGMILVGWLHFGRVIVGLAAAACYLILPYPRMGVVDSGQLVAATLTVWSVVWHNRPILTGLLLGSASGWIPACLGLLPLWGLSYRGRGALKFALCATISLSICVLAGWCFPETAVWARALGARTLASAGIGASSSLVDAEDLDVEEKTDPDWESFWSGIDPSYRLPVVILYLALTLTASFWPAKKNLGELIATSAGLLVASQFWYLDRGGALALLYLPLLLLMIFRPTIRQRKPFVPQANSSNLSGSGLLESRGK